MKARRWHIFWLSLAILAGAVAWYQSLTIVGPPEPPLPPPGSPPALGPDYSVLASAIKGKTAVLLTQIRRAERILHLAMAIQADCQAWQSVCDASASSSIPPPEGFLAEATDEAAINAFYADVSGSIDRWWRTPDWMSRDMIRYVATPAELQLAAYEMQMDRAEKDLKALRSLGEKLRTGAVLRQLRVKLQDVNILSAYKYDGPSSLQIADAYSAAGFFLIEVYGLGGDDEETVHLMTKAVRQTLRNTLGDCGGQESPLIARLMPLYPKLSELDRERELDAFRGAIVVHEELIGARRDAIERLRMVLQDRINRDRVDAFYNDLVGMYDAIKVFVQSRATSKLEKLLSERFDKYVINVNDISTLGVSITQDCSSRANRAIGRVFEEAINAVDPTPTLAALNARLPPIKAGDVALVGEWLRAAILVDVGDSLAMAGDLTLILAGVAGVPVSGGLSLLATAAGLVHMVADSTFRVLSTTNCQIYQTRILCNTQDLLVRAVFGICNPQATCARVSIVAGGNVTEGVLAQIQRTSMEQQTCVINQMLGSE